MKKKCFIFVLLLFCVGCAALVGSYGGASVFAAEEQQCKVVATECFLYQEPSFSSYVCDDDEQPVVLKHNDMVELLQGGQESEKFLFVSFGQWQGYVFKFYLTSNLDEQVVYPVFNAKVVKDGAEVFDLQQNPTGKKLAKGTELYLYEGYNKNTENGLTAVCFVDEGGGLFYGYLNTKDLEPYGINAWVITGIVVAASCITIILLLVFMKKRKASKKKEK